MILGEGGPHGVRVPEEFAMVGYDAVVHVGAAAEPVREPAPSTDTGRTA